MKYLLLLALMGGFILTDSVSLAEPVVKSQNEHVYTYRGKWVTTNRRLDGIQTAVVTWLGDEKWKMRVYGTWQGVDYDYTVNFTGPIDNLKGTATIDHAHYDWKGTITKKKFKATFSGSRYTGYFDMDRVEAK